jgi:S1-C subfamily serine protease
MTHEIAQAIEVDVTYGWMIGQVTSGGPADKAGLEGGTSQIQVSSGPIIVGGDIIIAFDGNRIRNTDDLSTYLEEHKLPNQTVEVTIVRDGETMTMQLKLGTRP